MFVIKLNQCILKKSLYLIQLNVNINFRANNKNEPLDVATLYHTTHVKNKENYKEFEKDGYKN